MVYALGNDRYRFNEHDLIVEGHKHNLIQLAEFLRDADGTVGDLRYQIEYEFDIDGIRTADVENDCPPTGKENSYG